MWKHVRYFAIRSTRQASRVAVGPPANGSLALHFCSRAGEECLGTCSRLFSVLESCMFMGSTRSGSYFIFSRHEILPKTGNSLGDLIQRVYFVSCWLVKRPHEQLFRNVDSYGSRQGGQMRGSPSELQGWEESREIQLWLPRGERQGKRVSSR